MTPTGWLVIGGCVLVVLYCGLVMAIEIFAKWGIQREAERTAAATFEAAYIPDSSEIEGPDAEVDALIALAQIEDEIDMALAPLREPE